VSSKKKTRDPGLSIGALARIAGVAPETIRTWEQRYGFPRAHRLPSGHRRYDAEAAEHIRLVRSALDAGLRPADAVPATPESLRLVLARRNVPRRGDHTSWLDHVAAYDADALDRCFARGLHSAGALGFVRDRVLPFLRELGDGWREGRFTVAQEHLVSERLVEFLATRWRPLSERATGPAIVCATLPGETHGIGIHLGALLLAGEGYRVIFLGNDCPVEDLATAARGRAVAVLVGVSRFAERKPTRSHLVTLSKQLEDVELLVGSRWRPPKRPGITWLESFEDLMGWTNRHGEFERTRG
jgi:methanogenic corrinoid protein MtbC1